MKTKQAKEESDKSVDDEAVAEPKTRARKKASDVNEEDKNKATHDEPKTSKETKKNIPKPKAIVKKRPLGVRKTLRNKKVVVSKEKLKKVIKQVAKRGRKPAIKTEPISAQDDKETLSLIPMVDIKKEPADDLSPNSRSSSPKTAGRRVRLSSDIMMMKSVLGESPSSLVVGPRTSPYSMRKERSNSPSLTDSKNLRSGKPRKIKTKLLNEVVIKEQKKRSIQLSDSKTNDTEATTEYKKLKRGRSCSRDGSEISKGSDVTESDISLNETIVNDTDVKELNKKLEKTKTDLDLDIENSVQISTIQKVPSLVFDSKTNNKSDTQSCSLSDEKKRKLSLKRSTSLDSDNNNGSKLKLVNVHSSLGLKNKSKILLKTDNDTLFNARSSILTSMSKRFNSKEMSKNIRKARRGRKAAANARATAAQAKTAASACISNDSTDEKHETLESLSKEIDDLITNLDQSLDHENSIEPSNTSVIESITTDSTQTKTVSKAYGLSKPLCDNNSIQTSTDTIAKDKEPVTMESASDINDDSENMRLQYDEDTADKSVDQGKQDIAFKCNVASIDKLMDRLKEFEELDKRRNRQESEIKPNDKQVMVSNDVVLIPKSGAEIKPLKDIQSVRSPERPLQKENVLSCFENNSAISIVKRDHVRKSIDVDKPNSVTLIKRNSISRKESTGSNHSRESTDTISFFEKSFGKDVTLTEIRKSVDKSSPNNQVDINQLATLLPTNPTQNIVGIVLDSKQISITTRMIDPKCQLTIPTMRISSDLITRNSSESAAEIEPDKATIEKIKSPINALKLLNTAATPVAIKSPETQPMDTDPVAPAMDIVKNLPENIQMATGVTDIEGKMLVSSLTTLKSETALPPALIGISLPTGKDATIGPITNVSIAPPTVSENVMKKPETVIKLVPKESSQESLAGPSNVIIETPESQVRKENILRTLGLLTHKAAKEEKDLKQKEKERIYGGILQNKNKPSKSNATDYTGTLKTVIKLNRSSGDRDKKRYRSSLKMTFQKSKNRSGKPSLVPGEDTAEEDAFYTIERREAGASATNDGGHRKSYSNRLNNHEPEAASEVVAVEPAKESPSLVIPEKASSFSIHPGRLCMDQCFYCGGKFGLFDTPCHIAQMKSAERQKKVLDNEEKLTIDSCLCDACYRHVDRRANYPSYRKRDAPKHLAIATAAMNPLAAQAEKTPSPPLEEESDEDSAAPATASGRPAVCHTEGCAAPADRSIRRKWLIKMRASVNKVLKLEGDYPGLHTIPLCGEHYRALAPLMACSLCKRSITKHYNVHFINHGVDVLNDLLAGTGLPVRLNERPLLCKLCRYYCSLLTRPNKHTQRERHYRRRLLQIHNVEVPPESEHDDEEMTMEEEANAKQKKKTKVKSKQRRSTEMDKFTEGEDAVKKDNQGHQQNNSEPMEEDIESLISSNKILVPGAPKNAVDNIPADMFEPETLLEVDPPLLHLDKQTELQYLLQKQNNPAQFLHKPRAQLHKPRAKPADKRKRLHWDTLTPGQLHRIHDANATRIQALGQIIIHKDKPELDQAETTDKTAEPIKTIMLTDQAILEMGGKKSADINTLKNKWQMSESFTQVKKNLSELSKKLTVEKVPKKLSDMKYSNPVKRLETNPSISVRELFPGEEEMNLQCNIEFNNVREVTREGWEKCSSTIQYDEETKRLWSELQRPYGSQSSFLRHLVILEKYFRNGELVLSAGASPAASAYSAAVASRLRAYDNLPPPPPTAATNALIDFRRTKPAAAVAGKSLLKSNQPLEAAPAAPAMPPPPPKQKQKIDNKNKKTLPPELIAINTPNPQGRKAIQNVLHNIQQLVKGVSASDPTEVAAAPLPMPVPVSAPAPAPATAATIIKVDTPKDKKEPKAESPKKQKTSSKPWRPTLMPITDENLAKIKKEPLQVAVDGRKMPSLVQVKCSDKRYHITLQDYNKMCIIRRGKLQQLQEGEKGNKSDGETIVTEIPPSAILGNGGTVKQSITIDKSPLIVDKSKATTDLGNAATILKNVGLKNITIAPIPAKSSMVTSPSVSSPAVVTSMPAGLALVAVPASEAAAVSPAVAVPMPKIPKSLTVIPQTATVAAAPNQRP